MLFDRDEVLFCLLAGWRWLWSDCDRLGNVAALSVEIVIAGDNASRSE
jgi:hypothetical protein